MFFGDKNPELEPAAAETMQHRVFGIANALYVMEQTPEIQELKAEELKAQQPPQPQPPETEAAVIDFEALKQQQLDKKAVEAMQRDVRIHEAKRQVDRAEAA